jgi:hypothetical protein
MVQQMQHALKDLRARDAGFIEKSYGWAARFNEQSLRDSFEDAAYRLL